MLRKGDVQTTTKNSFPVTGMLNVSKWVVVGIPATINKVRTDGDLRLLCRPCQFGFLLVKKMNSFYCIHLNL